MRLPNLRTSMSGRHLLIIFLFFSFSFSVLAQEEVVLADSSITKDGESFLVHRVAAKQTLYAISKAYGVQMSQLAFANPGIMDASSPGSISLSQKKRVLRLHLLSSKVPHYAAMADICSIPFRLR